MCPHAQCNLLTGISILGLELWPNEPYLHGARMVEMLELFILYSWTTITQHCVVQLQMSTAAMSLHYIFKLMWVCSSSDRKKRRKWEGNMIPTFSIRLSGCQQQAVNTVAWWETCQEAHEKGLSQIGEPELDAEVCWILDDYWDALRRAGDSGRESRSMTTKGQSRS